MKDIKLFHLLSLFSKSLEFLTPLLSGHHINVAYLSLCLAARLKLDKEKKDHLFIAAMLHDIGVVPLKMAVEDLIFEIRPHEHSIAGWAFCKESGLGDSISNAILMHHVSWKKSHNLLGNIIHLADRLDFNLRGKHDLLAALNKLNDSGAEFAPPVFNALNNLAQDKDFISYVNSSNCFSDELYKLEADSKIAPAQLMRLCSMFSLVIDCKSCFTATHSSGVAHVAKALFEEYGLANKEEAELFFVAGMLHDIGKLAVELEVLEKPAALSSEEFVKMKNHAKMSYEILSTTPGFKCISIWGGLHHERLDGKGYPLGISGAQIGFPTRIMTIADIFTALTEDRPYRSGLSLPETLKIMRGMSLDPDILDMLEDNIEKINQIRIKGQQEAMKSSRHLHEMCSQYAKLN